MQGKLNESEGRQNQQKFFLSEKNTDIMHCSTGTHTAFLLFLYPHINIELLYGDHE